MEFEVKRIADMNRAAYNPRVDLRPEDEEYQAIERSLKRHGLVPPHQYRCFRPPAVDRP